MRLRPRCWCSTKIFWGWTCRCLEEVINDCFEMVESLSAQEALQFVIWRKTFCRIPYKTFLQVAQAELKTSVTHMDPTFMGCTLPCSEAFRASLTVYARVVEDVKDKYYKPYILTAGDYLGCLFNTLPTHFPLPPHMFPPHLIPSPPSLLPTTLSSSHVPFPPAPRPHPPPSFQVIPSTSLPLPPPSCPCTSSPFSSYGPLTVLLPIFPLPPITLPPFLLSSPPSTPSFSAYVYPDPV